MTRVCWRLLLVTLLGASAACSDRAQARPIAAAVASIATMEPLAARATEVVPPAAAAPPSRHLDPQGALLPAAWASAPTMKTDAPGVPSSSAAATLLMDEASGAVLLDGNGHEPLPPASLTKIATAIVAIERGDLDRVVTTDVDSRTMRGSTVMGLIPGDQFTLRDLLYGMLLPSGNDAALAIGRAVAGSDAAFVEEMNGLLDRLGLTESHFVNPHGLNAPGHVTSAYDLAVLARYAMTLPEFRATVSTTAWTARGSRPIAVTNVIDGVLYSVPGADGVKSGFTRQAGRTMVASATRYGHRLYAVVLNDAQRESDVASLLNWGFTAFQWPAISADARAASLH